MWWALAACGPADRELAVDGVRIAVPADAVDLEPDGVEALRRAGLRDAPEQTVELVAVRTGDGMAWVQRNVEADAARYGSTVGAALDAVVADLGRSGSATTTDRDGGREVCVTGRWPDGDLDQPLLRCTLATVDPELALILSTAGCVGPAEPCATRSYPPRDALPPETAFPPPPPPPDLAIGPAAAWGLRFGASRTEFRAACAQAGLETDGFDWALDRPELRVDAAKGRLARCSGAWAPVPDPLGAVIRVDGRFADDRLIAASVHLARSVEAVEPVLAAAYPRGVVGEDEIVHLVDEDAAPDEILTVAVGPSTAPGALSRLTLMTRRAADPR